MRKSVVKSVLLICMISVLFSAHAFADTLTVVENQVTSTALYETTPTLGNDGRSDIVVYTARELLPNGFYDPGDIYYQPLDSAGSPNGDSVQVTSGLTDDRLNDVSGDYIVFTSYDNVDTYTGSIMLYQISTGFLQPIGEALVIQEARIHGNTVVWVQGAVAASEIMKYDLSWLGTTHAPEPLTGSIPSTCNVDVGDRFVVWVEVHERLDIGAYDLADKDRIRLTDSPLIDERQPSTSGDWIAWESRDVGATNSRIEAVNLVTGDYRIIADDGSVNARPSIDGDLIAYESNNKGNYDVYLYRISTMETFAVTTHPDDQYLNDVFGNKVAYVSYHVGGDEDVWVASFTFLTPGPLVAHYPLDGDANDASGNNLHGTIHGGATFTADGAGNPTGALALDGVDDYVELPFEGAFDLTELTIMARVKVPDYQQENWIISKGPSFGNYTLRIHDSVTEWPGYAGYTHQTSTGNWSSLVSGGEVPTSEFFNIAVTLSPTEFRGYINGGSRTMGSNPDPPALNNEPVTIGAGGYLSLSDFFTGVIDEVRIYNVALSATEIRDLHDTPPVADAGEGQTVHPGTVVTLDGSASFDPDGHYPLAYSWAITSAPAGSSAALSDPAAVGPWFTADIMGRYTLELVVTDSLGLASAPDTVTVSTTNSAPIADAGPNQAVILIGTTVLLDGTQSYDLEGDPLSYSWTLVQKPDTSAAFLSDPSSATPTFVADAKGTYVAELVVSDPWDASEPGTVCVSFENLPPVADPGGNQSVLVGDTVVLDGSGSSDPNGDTLSYSWSFVSRPDGSEALLSGENSVSASFTPDVAGEYVVSLVVNDGTVPSLPQNAQIVAITSQSAVTTIIGNVITIVNDLDPDVLRNGNLANALTNKLNAVLAMIDRGEYAEALDKLTNDILGKTDGCANTGTPDRNDWITDCAAQGEVYPLIIEAIDILSGLVP